MCSDTQPRVRSERRFHATEPPRATRVPPRMRTACLDCKKKETTSVSCSSDFRCGTAWDSRPPTWPAFSSAYSMRTIFNSPRLSREKLRIVKFVVWVTPPKERPKHYSIHRKDYDLQLEVVEVDKYRYTQNISNNVLNILTLTTLASFTN